MSQLLIQLSNETEIKNRGVKDILILCADGLKGLKEAIGTVYPTTEFQSCLRSIFKERLNIVPVINPII